MNRRSMLVGAGGVVLAGVASKTTADSVGGAAYDISLEVRPAKEDGEFECSASLKAGETGQIRNAVGSFKRGTTGTVRTGEGRPDGSSIDLTVEVAVDSSGQHAELTATVTDRGKVVTIQRSSFTIAKA